MTLSIDNTINTKAMTKMGRSWKTRMKKVENSPHPPDVGLLQSRLRNAILRFCHKVPRFHHHSRVHPLILLEGKPRRLVNESTTKRSSRTDTCSLPTTVEECPIPVSRDRQPAVAKSKTEPFPSPTQGQGTPSPRITEIETLSVCSWQVLLPLVSPKGANPVVHATR